MATQINFIPQGQQLSSPRNAGGGMTTYTIFTSMGQVYATVPSGQEAAYTIPASYAGQGGFLPNLPAGMSLQQVVANNQAKATAAAAGVTLPPPTVQQGMKPGPAMSGPGSAPVPNMVPNPEYQAAVAQIDPAAALQLAVNSGGASFSPMTGLAQNAAPVSTITGADGKTYYYVPQSWGAGGGGYAQLSPEQAKALGGTSFTQPGYIQGQVPSNVDAAQNAMKSGYLFSTNPNLMPESTGVNYTPGSNTFAKDLANFAATVALPATAMFAPALLPATMGGASATQGAVLGAGVGGIGGGYQGAILGGLTGGLAAGLGGGAGEVGSAGTGLSDAEMAALGGLEIPAGTTAGGLSSGLSAAEMGALGGLEIPAGTTAGGLSSTGLSSAEMGALGGLDIPAGTAASGAGSSAGGALDAVMPGAGTMASGATGGLAPGGVAAGSGGGLNSLLGSAGDWIMANPTKALGVLGSLLTLGGGLAGTGGNSSGSTSPTAPGGAGSGGPLPVRAPLNRVQTPYPGDYKTYGQTAAPGGGGGWNFFGGAPAAHAHGGPIGPLSALPPSRHSGPLLGPGGGQDDMIDAKVANGEYVIDASTVSDLGDGSNEAGAAKLDQLVHHVRKHKRGGAKGLPPKAKAPLSYIGSKS